MTCHTYKRKPTELDLIIADLIWYRHKVDELFKRAQELVKTPEGDERTEAVDI